MWSYTVYSLSGEEQRLRRDTLDRFALYAQLSAVGWPLAWLCFRSTRWAARAAAGCLHPLWIAVVPQASPDGAYYKESGPRRQPSSRLSRACRKIAWWFDDDVVLGGERWGRRMEWAVGSLWMAWLLLLCFVGTGHDYMHLTKRFGIVGASQLPTQYLLVVTSSMNPYAWAFRQSHENLSRWHQILGRIIGILFLLHAIFYLGYFQSAGVLFQRLSSPTVALGLSMTLGVILISMTSCSAVRRFSYRLFLIPHVVFSLALPPLLFFHVRHARIFILEALGLYFLDVFVRWKRSITSHASVQSVPGTELIRISALIPPEKIKSFRWRPGTFAYVGLAAASRPSRNPAYAFANPFTLEAFDPATGAVTLIARQQSGPLTSALAQHAQKSPYYPTSSTDSGRGGGGAMITLEGPYGSARHFPQFSEANFDHILLISGGVGATFILPIFRQLKEEKHTETTMVWLVRRRAETVGYSGGLVGPEGDVTASAEGLRVFETRAPGPAAESGTQPAEGATEGARRRRPNLGRIVDDAFEGSPGPRVAVLVCGRPEMSRQVRQHVAAWVRKGWQVWWHEENFAR